MHKTLRAMLILACLLLQACGPAQSSAAELPVQSLPLSQGQAVFVELDGGSLDVSSGDGASVQLSGQVPSLKEQGFSLTSSADGIHIVSTKARRPFWQQSAPLLHLILRVPSGTDVDFHSSEAGVNVHDFRGTLNATSVSGAITVSRSSGVFVLNSNRGDVTVQAASGDIRIAGNYGLLSVQDTRGKLNASTIMGTVRFVGDVKAGDNVALETDHGPVEIRLANPSDAAVHVRTTTGVITCIMPGLSYEGQACGGTLGSGKGQLTVRTVSGAVRLQAIP